MSHTLGFECPLCGRTEDTTCPERHKSKYCQGVSPHGHVMKDCNMCTGKVCEDCLKPISSKRPFFWLCTECGIEAGYLREGD